MSTIGALPPSPPVPQPTAAPPAPTKVEDPTPGKPESPAVQVSLSSHGKPDPSLKVNSDGTVGPHHKPRHAHSPGGGQSQLTATTPLEGHKLPGSIKV